MNIISKVGSRMMWGCLGRAWGRRNVATCNTTNTGSHSATGLVMLRHDSIEATKVLPCTQAMFVEKSRKTIWKSRVCRSGGTLVTRSSTRSSCWNLYEVHRNGKRRHKNISQRMHGLSKCATQKNTEKYFGSILVSEAPVALDFAIHFNIYCFFP